MESISAGRSYSEVQTRISEPDFPAETDPFLLDFF